MNQKNQKGITLIALVITIIVLLILAGITINMVLGEDGIIAQAQQAKAMNKDAAIEQELEMIRAEKELANYGLDPETQLSLKPEDVIKRLVDKKIVTTGELIPRGIQAIKYSDGTKEFSIEGIVEWDNTNAAGLKIEDGVVVGFLDESILETITRVIIPEGVTKIGHSAFYEITEIKGVEIPDSVKIIDVIAFYGCTGLTSITIPDSVEEIDGDAFYACSNLAEIIVEEDNRIYSSADGVLFNKEKTELIKCPEGKAGNYEIPKTVAEIGDQAFVNCNSLTKIEFEEGTTIEVIGGNAFWSCLSLEEIVLPNTVTTIDYQAFAGCANLKNVNIPSSVKSIGECAFIGCTSLPEITIPSNVISMGEGAFNYCYNLEKVVILNKDLTIYSGTFKEDPSVESQKDITIHGYAGSTAETYVEEHNKRVEEYNKTEEYYLERKIDFVALD